MSPSRKRLWLAAQAALAVAILVAVGRHFWKMLDDDAIASLSIGPRAWYLVPTGLLYLGAHTIWGTYWWMLLRNQKVQVNWSTGVRAYFVSQFGKYVPGKVWVLVLRMMILHRVPGATKRIVGLTAMYETLINMAAGAMLAAVLIPHAGIGGEFTQGRVPFLVAAAALPLGLFGLVRLVNRITRLKYGSDAQAVSNTPLWLLLVGVVQTACGWCLLAVSLRLMTWTLWPAVPQNYATELVSVTASYIVGFLAFFLPGGLGARELVLQECLAMRLTGVGGNPAGNAVVVALLLRLVWTAFEVTFAGLLYLSSKVIRRPAETPP
jgi:glycosyltransferase 2 family protein